MHEMNVAWGGQLDAYGRFLKIVAHSCHANKLNMYSQVPVCLHGVACLCLSRRCSSMYS
jgi:hypothetical protein